MPRRYRSSRFPGDSAATRLTSENKRVIVTEPRRGGTLPGNESTDLRLSRPPRKRDSHARSPLRINLAAIKSIAAATGLTSAHARIIIRRGLTNRGGAGELITARGAGIDSFGADA